MAEDERIKILYVEDEEVDCMALKRVVSMRSLPYDVDLASVC